MEITLNLSDEIAHLVAPEGKDPARVALEALALEGYRSEALGENDVRRMLGFRKNLEVHGFLKEHGVYLQYSAEDLEEDLESARELAEKIQAERVAAKTASDDRRR